MNPLYLILALTALNTQAVPAPQDSSSTKSSRQMNDPAAVNSTDPESRFLSPVALEGLGRLFMLQSELSSCHSCSRNFPQHSSSCCVQGYPECCIFKDPYYNVNNGGVPVSGYGPSYNNPGFNNVPFIKDGTCPLVPQFPLTGQQSCSRQCNQDVECPADLKCCLYGCSMICSPPQYGNLAITVGSSVGFEKSGYCPPNSELALNSDSVFAASSYSSSNGINYGYTGYGYNTYPLKTPFQAANGEDYFQFCSADSDCPGSHKCCLRRYQRVCLVPTFSAYSYGRK